MSEPFSLDSLPDWKTVVWNVVNEIDLEKSSIWLAEDWLNLFVDMVRLL